MSFPLSAGGASPPFDPRFGFTPELERAAAPEASGTSGAAARSGLTYYDGPLPSRGIEPAEFHRFESGPEAAQARCEIAATMDRLAAHARSLLPARDRMPAIERLHQLPGAMTNPHHRLFHVDIRILLYGTGKRALERMAELLSTQDIPLAARREALENAIEALEFCAIRIGDDLPLCVRALERAGGAGVRVTASVAVQAMQRAMLADFSRRMIAADPRCHFALAAYEVHYVAGLAQRLGLSEATAGPVPEDRFLGPEHFDAHAVRRCACELRDRIRPGKVARLMADEALAQMQGALRAADAGLEDLDLLRPATRSAFQDAKQDIERRLGPIRDGSFLDVGDGVLRLWADSCLIAADVLNNLTEAGALPAEPPRRVVAWEAGRLALMTMRLDVSFVREDDDPGSDRPVTLSELHMLDRLAQCAGLRLTDAQREGMSATAIAMTAPDRLMTLRPEWIVTSDLAQALMRRIGVLQLTHWWARHSAGAALPEPLRHRLMVAASRDSEPGLLAALMPTTGQAGARAWEGCDALGELGRALAVGDIILMQTWLRLFRVACVALSPRQCHAALQLKDDRGRAALLRALEEGHLPVLRLMMEATRHAASSHRPATAPGRPPERVVDAALCARLLTAPEGRRGPRAVCAALSAGRTEALQAYLGEVMDPARELPRDAVKALFLGIKQVQALAQPALTGLMTLDRASTVETWLGALGEAARRRDLAPEDHFEMIAACDREGYSCLQRAMEAGAVGAVRAYLAHVERASHRRQLTEEQTVSLLLFPARRPGLMALAVRHGRVACLEVYLETLERMARNRHFWEHDLDTLFLPSGDPLPALGEAVLQGNAAAIGSIVRTASALRRQGCFDGPTLATAMSPGWNGRPLSHHALLRPDTAALSAWTSAVVEARSNGALSRLQCRWLLKGEDERHLPALNLAARAGTTRAVQALCTATLSARRADLLKDWDVWLLLSARWRGESALAGALRLTRPGAISALCEAFEAAHGEHLVPPRLLGEWIAARAPTGRRGLGHLQASGLLRVDVVDAYARGVINAVRLSSLSVETGRQLLMEHLDPACEPDRRTAIRQAVSLRIRQERALGRLTAAQAAGLQGRC